MKGIFEMWARSQGLPVTKWEKLTKKTAAALVILQEESNSGRYELWKRLIESKRRIDKQEVEIFDLAQIAEEMRQKIVDLQNEISKLKS